MESAEKVPDYHNINFFGTSPFRKRLTVHEARNERSSGIFIGEADLISSCCGDKKKQGVLGYWSRPQFKSVLSVFRIYYLFRISKLVFRI